jgi:putative Ig domain-containing protein
MRSKTLLAMVGAALVLTACFDENAKSNGEPNVGNPPPAQNIAPTISGAPPPNILEGEAYEFIPTAADADGDTLEFTIARKPAWASFDAATGRLWGTPDTADVGNFTNVGISVSDGQASASLANFDITVNGIALGQATISWNPPTENADGTTLTNLAGYRIYYGRNANTLSQSIVINNPGLTRYVVDNLSPAKWYFAMTSVNSIGAESARSPKVSKTVS